LDYLHFPFSKLCGTPHLTTLHGRLDIPELPALYRKFPHVPVASISLSQRQPLPWINWIGNFYHGLPVDSLLPNSGQGGYLAFLGRIAPEKRVDRAIQIAIESGIPLKIAAKVDPSDREYYEAQIKPLLRHPNIEYLGEIREQEKAKFLGDAFAHLFPIDWREPFGLCMIEAMACGTPSIAFDRGSVREVLTNRVSGIVVNNVEEAVLAVQQVASLSRVACRKEFESRFTASRMADKYVTLYESLLGGDGLSTPPAGLDTTLISGTASV
jgi:glycosyltransferase involved in cell wall biosynthesis